MPRDLPWGDGRDEITIVHAPNRRMAKHVRSDRTIVGYDRTKRFDFTTRTLTGLDDLEAVLRHLLSRPECAVVRGRPLGVGRNERRLLYHDPRTGEGPTLADVPRRWLALDFDDLPHPAEVAVNDLQGLGQAAAEVLPPGFRTAARLVQATGSHGFKSGARLRLWFWLNRPTTSQELRDWLAAFSVDTSVFGPAQLIYTARPLLDHGVVDPCPNRLLLTSGQRQVAVPSELGRDIRTPVRPSRRLPETNSTDTIMHQITHVLSRLETAQEGMRHLYLRNAALTIGGLLDVAGLSEREAEDVLISAVMRAGGAAVDIRNARATVTWGLEHGRARPLAVRPLHA